MARFYSNENFPLPVVERLRALGHDVLTTYEAGFVPEGRRTNSRGQASLPSAAPGTMRIDCAPQRARELALRGSS